MNSVISQYRLRIGRSSDRRIDVQSHAGEEEGPLLESRARLRQLPEIKELSHG